MAKARPKSLGACEWPGPCRGHDRRAPARGHAQGRRGQRGQRGRGGCERERERDRRRPCRTLSGFAKGVPPAVMQIARLVARDEVDDAGPEPARRIQGLGSRPCAAPRARPRRSARPSGARAPCRPRRRGSAATAVASARRQLLDLQLQVLRQQLAQEHRLAQQVGRPACGRPGAATAARAPSTTRIAWSSRHARVRVRGRGRGHGLLDVDQAVLQIVAALLAHRQHHGVAQQARANCSPSSSRPRPARPPALVVAEPSSVTRRDTDFFSNSRATASCSSAPAPRTACRGALRARRRRSVRVPGASTAAQGVLHHAGAPARAAARPTRRRVPARPAQ